tara:strand:+ start:43707 stop:43889 length:183 start_codon:yes stop_codon:yes gene_type:complete
MYDVFSEKYGFYLKLENFNFIFELIIFLDLISIRFALPSLKALKILNSSKLFFDFLKFRD